MTPAIINSPRTTYINTTIPALLVIFSFSGFAAESESCTQAKKIYEKNRKEQRSGYKIRRGNWLNCVEDLSNDAKRKYCRLKKVNDHKYTSVKAEIEGGCTDRGIKRY